MPTAKSEFGKEGEDFAALYLSGKGYKILGRNVRTKFGEMDLIADKGGKLTFVEVKAVKSNLAGFRPEDHLGRSKLEKTRRMCEFLANSRPELVKDRKGWQLDAVCLLKTDTGIEVAHYENIA